MTHMDDSAIRATIKPPHARQSVTACVWRGTLDVNLPVLGIMLVGGIAAWLSVHLTSAGAPINGSQFAMACAVFLAGIAAAWTWWSFTVPHWRIWALQNIDNWPALRRQAIRAGLIWPDGWIFEKTEIKSPALRHMEQVLRRIRETEG